MTGGAVPRPYDERLRALGDQVVQRFLALIRVARSYEVGNQVFRLQLEHFMTSLRPVFDDSDEAVLVALESDLYLNGVRIPVRNQTFKAHEQLREEFERRRIAGLKLTKDVSLDEVQRFFALFLKPGDHHGAGLLEACLAEGLDTIQPAVHASTSVPEAASFASEIRERAPSWPEEPLDAFDKEAPTAPGEGGDAPRGAAPKSFHAAVAGARSLLMTTTLHDTLELRQAKRVVQPLVDGAFDHQPVVLGLATLGHHDEYTYMHAVNVGMVAVTLGHLLGLDRRALADLGVAALLHDVGKAAVADKVHHPIGHWTEEEREAAERHVVEGARHIARATILNGTTVRCMRVALEHHAGSGGYPLLDRAPSVLSQVVAVADCYVSLLSHRSERGQTMTPNQAIGMMLGPLASRFEPALLWALVKSVGLFPPGQMVELADGTKAVVLAPNPDDLLRPHVRTVTTPTGEWLAESERVDHRPLREDLFIRYALRAEDYPTPPAAPPETRAA